VLHDLTADLKLSAANGETDKTIITAPPSIKEFREQRRRKRKLTDDVDKQSKKPTTYTMGENDPQSQARPEVPVRKFFSPLTSIEMEADHGDDTTEHQQHQTPSSLVRRPCPIVLTS
jgi:hypothetical protein